MAAGQKQLQKHASRIRFVENECRHLKTKTDALETAVAALVAILGVAQTDSD